MPTRAKIRLVISNIENIIELKIVCVVVDTHLRSWGVVGGWCGHSVFSSKLREIKKGKSNTPELTLIYTAFNHLIVI